MPTMRKNGVDILRLVLHIRQHMLLRVHLHHLLNGVQGVVELPGRWPVCYFGRPRFLDDGYQLLGEVVL